MANKETPKKGKKPTKKDCTIDFGRKDQVVRVKTLELNLDLKVPNYESPRKEKEASQQSTTESKIEYSIPLTMKRWAFFFGLSPNKLRELRKNKTYHFRQISPRRWALPKHELPTEYLETYRHIVSKS